MRNRVSVNLGADRVVNVQELRVRDARNLMAQAKLFEQLDINELLTIRFDDLVALIGDGLQMPDGETLEDLAFSEIEQVKVAWLEVNAGFLALLGLAPRPVPDVALSPALPTSTAPVSH
jgi:hypothetical protein